MRFLIYWALIALIIFLPIPFGGVLPWTWSAMVLFVGVVTTFWGISALLGITKPWKPPPALTVACVLFLLVMSWALLQTLSVVPEGLHHPLWKTALEALGLPNGGSISLDPVASREHVLRIVAYGAIFWLALQISRDRDYAATLLYWICGAVSLNALYGLVVQLSGSNTILWFEKTSYLDLVTGTFVNRNSFATYIGLGLICATAILWDRAQLATRGITNPTERRRILLTQMLEKNWPVLASWFVLSVALLLTQSRAGTFATIIALFTLIIVLGARGARSRKSLIVPAALAIVALLFVFRLSGSGLDARLHDTELAWSARSQIYDIALSAIDDTTLTGTGLGTFPSVYLTYATHGSIRSVQRAHSDYLELAVELGVPAAILFITSLFVVTLTCARGVFRRSRDFVFPAAGLSASVLVGIHSIVDFSLQIPAVAVTYCLILGIASAQSSSSRD